MAEAILSVFEAQCRLNGLSPSTPAQLAEAREIAIAAGKWPRPHVPSPPIERQPTGTLLFLVTVPEAVIVQGGLDGEQRVVMDPERIEGDIRETLYLHNELRFDKVQGADVKFIEDPATRVAIEELEPELVYYFDEEPDVHR